VKTLTPPEYPTNSAIIHSRARGIWKTYLRDAEAVSRLFDIEVARTCEQAVTGAPSLFCSPPILHGSNAWAVSPRARLYTTSRLEYFPSLSRGTLVHACEAKNCFMFSLGLETSELDDPRFGTP
jgi:hypothetical protein